MPAKLKEKESSKSVNPKNHGSDWQMVKLGDVCEFIRGVSFDRSEVFDLKQQNTIPILRAGNISEELDTVNNLVWVKANKVSQNQLLQPSDIAICMSSGSSDVVGKTAIVKKIFDGSVGAFCGIIRPKKNITPLFIGYWFKSSNYLRFRDEQARGANIQNLRFSEFSSLQIPLPPLDEQKRLSSILNKADRIRKLRKTAREHADSFLQSVFLEMFGDPVKNPMGWEIVELGELIESAKNGLYLHSSSYGSGVPIIRITEFYDGVLASPNTFKRVRASSKEVKEFSTENGNILINRVNSLEYLGKCALVKGLEEVTVYESNMIKLVIKDNLIHSRFFVQILCDDFVKAQILQKARKAVNQASINQDDVKSLKVLLPPLSLQNKFAEIVNKFEKQRNKMIEAERQAEELFQSLLHRAFQPPTSPKGQWH